MGVGRCLVAAALVAQGAVAMAGEPFSVTITASPTRVPLGVPADLMVEVKNVSAAAVPVAFNRPPLAVLAESEAGSETYCPFCTGRWGVIRRLVPKAWRHLESLEIPLNTVGNYTLRVVLKHHWNIDKKPVEYPDLWWSRSVSKPIHVEVTEPTGVDKQAYEAFNHNPLGNHDRLGELLRRFPTSTYAAYVVWKKTWPGARPVKIEDIFYSMQHGPRSFGQLYLPCVDADSPACRDMGYPPPGEEAARRQAGWIDLVLKHHPDIWFGDELRFKRAYAAYFLGDKPACAVGLEELADHGKAYVAAKAGDLLSAMRAKGMLPKKGE